MRKAKVIFLELPKSTILSLSPLLELYLPLFFFFLISNTISSVKYSLSQASELHYLCRPPCSFGNFLISTE